MERKRFAIAIHDRGASEASQRRISDTVDSTAPRHPRLRVTGGKRIHELRPDLDWDKGKALPWLIDELDLAHDECLPLYIGDDETDEDAFMALEDRELGFVVRGEDDGRSTRADYALADPREVRRLLEKVAGWAGPARSSARAHSP